MASNLRLLIPQRTLHCPYSASPRSQLTPPVTPSSSGPCPPSGLTPAAEPGLVQLIRVCHDACHDTCHDAFGDDLPTGATGGAADEPQSFHLRGKAWVTIGRSERACVRLSHPTVSRWHAALMHADDGQLYVIDFGSAHGTRTFSKPLCSNVAVPVKSGALIRFGDDRGPLFLVKLFCELDSGTLPKPPALHLATSVSVPAPCPVSPPPTGSSTVVAEADGGSAVAPASDDDGPLSPHTVANTRLNTVLPSFADPKRCRALKRLLLGEDADSSEHDLKRRKRVSF